MMAGKQRRHGSEGSSVVACREEGAASARPRDEGDEDADEEAMDPSRNLGIRGSRE